MVKIPRLFRSKTINVEGEDIELRAYKVIDNEYVIPLQKKRNEIITLSLRLFKLSHKEDGTIEREVDGETIEVPKTVDKTAFDYTEEDFNEVTRINNELDDLKEKVDQYSAKIAQRGLKRFYYKDEPEYKEARRDNQLTEYIDSLPDIPVDFDNQRLIANTMIELGSPTNPPKPDVEEDGKGKQKRGQKKRSSKASDKKS